jgi:molecular chaperone GrpE
MVRVRRQGVELTFGAFRDTLVSLGVEPTEALHQPFDPNWHEAAGVEEVSEASPGVVIAEEQTGYTYRGK